MTTALPNQKKGAGLAGTGAVRNNNNIAQSSEFATVKQRLRDGMRQGQMHICIRDNGRLAGGYAAAGRLTESDVAQLENIAVDLSINADDGRRQWRLAVAHGCKEPLHRDGHALTWDSTIGHDGAPPPEPPPMPGPADDWQLDGCRYLKALFHPDELVNIVVDCAKSGDKFRPSGRGSNAPRDLWIRHAADGIIAKTVHADAGAWVRLNPVDNEGITDLDITAYRHCLVESDDMPLADQWRQIQLLRLPCSAIVHSGAKSLHAVVRIDAADADQYKQRVAYLYETCNKAGLTVDPANRNPSRLSRLPGVMRGAGKQYLLDVNTGAASWESWEAEQERRAAIVAAAEWPEPAPLGGIAEPLAKWPCWALPAPLRDMVDQMGLNMGTDAAMASMAVIGAASTALGNRAQVLIKSDHRQFGNLYVMIAAEVGGGKTPLFKAVPNPLIKWQRREREKYLADLRAYRARKERIEAQQKKLRRAVESGKDVLPEQADAEFAALDAELGAEPTEPALFTNDATSEAIGRLMAANGECLGVISGEARKVLAIAKGRYADGGDIDLWLAGHGGDYIRIDRAGRESLTLTAPCLSATIATQPDSMTALGKSDALRESGFLARWLYVVPDPKLGLYNRGNIPHATAERYQRLLIDMIDMPLATDDNGVPCPHRIRLSADAFELFVEYTDTLTHERTANRETIPLAMQSWLSKLAEHAARLALLFHCCERSGAWTGDEISEETLGNAIAVCDALRPHAARAFAAMGDSIDVVRGRQVLAWIVKNVDKLRQWREQDGTGAILAVKARDVVRAGVAGLSKSVDAASTLDYLEERGWLRRHDVNEPGRKTATHYAINPAAIEVKA
jgi:hypothetical protein